MRVQIISRGRLDMTRDTWSSSVSASLLDSGSVDR